MKSTIITLNTYTTKLVLDNKLVEFDPGWAADPDTGLIIPIRLRRALEGFAQ